MIQFQPAPDAGTMFLQVGHTEFHRRNEHVVFNAVVLSVAKSLAKSHNVTLPVAEGESTWITVDASAILDPPMQQLVVPTPKESEHEAVFAALSVEQEELVYRPLPAVEVDAILELFSLPI
jgi:hypothetical protein